MNASYSFGSPGNLSYSALGPIRRVLKAPATTQRLARAQTFRGGIGLAHRCPAGLMALTEPVSAAATVESSLAAATAGISAASSGSLADYVIEKAIGRGHFSTVHRAVRRSDERRVALKKVQIFDMLDAKARDRCLKEVDLLKTLKPHPCIIQYIDSFIDNSELYIVFEWAEHGDLRRLLRRANESKTSLQEVQVWRYFVQVCDGIRHMHEARIMHRDIKPANIFLASNGSVKLGDLGLGRAFSSQTYEALSKVGTPLYMSPEVLDGRGYEWKSDVWSLGCLLYELATLRSPFKAEGDNLYTLFKKISVGKYEALPAHHSPALQSLVQHMIQLDPTRRLDIHATLEFAKKALNELERQNAAGANGAAASAAAGAAGSGGNGVAAAAMAISDCLIVMEAVGDKLKLLDYERQLLRARSLPPLPCAYFTGAPVEAAEAAQLEYLYTLTCWLLQVSVAPGHELWKLVPTASSATYDADAGAACAALLHTLSKAPAPLASLGAMPPHRLRAARGAEVCAMLNALTDAALTKAGFVWASPQHGQSLEGEGDVEELEGDADEAIPRAPAKGAEPSEQREDDGQHLPVQQQGRSRERARHGPPPPMADEEDKEADEDDAAADDEDGVDDVDDVGGAGSARVAEVRYRRRRPRRPPKISASAWAEESERLASQLTLQVSWQKLAWRHRLALAQQHAPPFAREAPFIEAPLERICSQQAGRVAAVAPLQAEADAAAATRDAASEAVANTQQRVDALSSELMNLEDEISRTKAQAAGRGVELSGSQPLDMIRAALRALRLEVKALAVREAMASKALATRRIAEERLRGREAREGSRRAGATGDEAPTRAVLDLELDALDNDGRGEHR